MSSLYSSANLNSLKLNTTHKHTYQGSTSLLRGCPNSIFGSSSQSSSNDALVNAQIDAIKNQEALSWGAFAVQATQVAANIGLSIANAISRNSGNQTPGTTPGNNQQNAGNSIQQGAQQESNSIDTAMTNYKNGGDKATFTKAVQDGKSQVSANNISIANIDSTEKAAVDSDNNLLTGYNSSLTTEQGKLDTCKDTENKKIETAKKSEQTATQSDKDAETTQKDADTARKTATNAKTAYTNSITKDKPEGDSNLKATADKAETDAQKAEQKAQDAMKKSEADRKQATLDANDADKAKQDTQKQQLVVDGINKNITDTNTKLKTDTAALNAKQSQKQQAIDANNQLDAKVKTAENYNPYSS